MADSFVSALVALIMRVLITSTGEHAVVATRPYFVQYGLIKSVFATIAARTKILPLEYLTINEVLSLPSDTDS